MDIRIKDGDWVHTGGNLEMVSGTEEIIQHAVMRLQARRGRFYGDTAFGSYLYRLIGSSEKDRSLLGLQYAAQALEGMPQVWPERVDWEGDTVKIMLHLPAVQKEVTLCF